MPARSVNQALADFLLKYSHYIERFANGTVEELVGIYATARPAILKMMRDLEDFGEGPSLPFRLRRLREMLNEVNMVLRHSSDDAVAALAQRLSQFATQEAATQAAMLGSAAGAIGIDIMSIPVETVLAMVHTPLGGATFAERMAENYRGLTTAIQRELTQALVMGEGMAPAARRLFGVGAEAARRRGLAGIIGDRLRHQAEVIARTEILRVNNEVRDAMYEANRDVVKGVQYVATLDHRTCLVCGARDGKVFIYGVNDPTPADRPISGTHPNCRCLMVPVLKSWEELGVIGKVPKEKDSPRFFKYVGPKPLRGMGPMEQYADPEMWSGYVTDKVKYSDWLRRIDKEDPAFARDVLGPTLYKAWKGGRALGDMVSGNKVLTLDELKGMGD